MWEKILIACLMGAGMGATGIAIARLFLIMGFLGKGPTAMMNIKQDILWGMELTIGVLTASIPPLKAPIQRVLESWGVLRSNVDSDASFVESLPNEPRIVRQMGQWNSGVLERAPESQEGLRDGKPGKLGVVAPSEYRGHAL